MAGSRFPSTRAEVSLDAIRSNIRTLKGIVGASDVMAVVKAEGYGHGALEVSRAALQAGARWLGVYKVSEGAALRHAGIDAPVLVFGPFEDSESRAIVEERLTPTITSREAAEGLHRAAGSQRVKYHLKIDTGLSRAGVAPNDALELLRELSTYGSLSFEGSYTHLASADEDDKTTTYRQLRVFDEVVKSLEAEGFAPSLRHAANTAAALDVPESRLDLVRCGIGVYGYHPNPACVRRDLEPALRLFSSTSRVFTLPPGAGVGYGHEYVTSRHTVIGVVPLGYGDGLPRALGNGKGKVLVRGRLVPVLGRVSMDQITIDVTGFDGIDVGERVTLIGRDGDGSQSANDVAQQAGTISYEILSRLMPRVPRVYTDNG